MWLLLIPAAIIIGSWFYGASKVSTPPLAHDPEQPIPLPGTGTVDGHGTGVVGPQPLKVGDTVIADFANAIDVVFKVTDAKTPDSSFIMVSHAGGAAMQMPKDSIKKVIPS